MGGNFRIPTGLPTFEQRVAGPTRDTTPSISEFLSGAAQHLLDKLRPAIDAYVPPVTQDFGSYMDELLTELEHQMALQREAHEQGLADIVNAYQGDIDETVRRIGEAQGAQGDVDLAYDKYRGLITKYADRARVAVADPEQYAKNIDNLQEEALVSVAGAFDSAEEAVSDMLLLIGADDPDLANSLSAEVREFDQFAKEAIQEGGDNEEAIMRAGIDLTDKLIDSTQSDDILEKEMARQATQARLSAYLEDLVRQKKRLEDQMAEDVRRANAEFEASYGEEITPEGLFDWSFQRWGQDQQFNSEEMFDLRAEFDGWYTREGVRTTAEMTGIIQADIFRDNAETVALDQRNWALWASKGWMTDPLTPNIDAITDFLATYSSASSKLSRGIGSGEITFKIAASNSTGEEQISLFLPDQGFRDKFDDPDVQNLLHMFDLWRLSVDRAGEVANRFQDTLSMNPTTGWVFPISNTTGYSDYFNKPHTKRDGNHMGIDVFAPRGSIISSPVSGKVSRIVNTGSPGYAVYVKGANGIEYVFMHMNQKTHLQVGESVQAGALLGYVGNSGSASGTQTHVHFEMRQNGKWINPYQHLQASEGRGAGGTPSFGDAVGSGRPTSSGTPSSSGGSGSRGTRGRGTRRGAL